MNTQPAHTQLNRIARRCIVRYCEVVISNIITASYF